MRCLGLAIAALVFTGCANSHEERVKAWNDFWGVDKKKQRPVAKRSKAKREARKQKPRQKVSRAEPQSSNSNDVAPDDRGDPKAIENYANRVQPRNYGEYQPNDHISKIERQQDPSRRQGNQTAMVSNDDYSGSNSEFGESAPSQSGSAEWPDSVGSSAVVRTASIESESNEVPSWTATDGTQTSSTDSSSTTVSGPASVVSADDSVSLQPSSAEEPSVVVSSENEPIANTPPADVTTTNTESSFIASDGGDGQVTANVDTSTSIHEAENEPLQTAELADLAPSLAEVKVSAGPEPTEQTTDGTEVAEAIGSTADAANVDIATPPTESADTYANRLKKQEELVKKDPNNVEEQYRLRMMYLINGEDEKALAPAEGIDADLQEIIQAQIKALIDARSSTGRDPASWANRQIESVEELRRQMRSRADLNVPQVVLCTAIEGFGRYDPIEPAEFPVGRRNLVLVYIEIDNFTSKQTTSGLYRTLLSVRQELFNKAGESLWNKKDENIEDLARQKRRDFYLTVGPIAIPKTLPPGEYSLKVEVEDVLAGKMNGRAATFRIVP